MERKVKTGHAWLVRSGKGELGELESVRGYYMSGTLTYYNTAIGDLLDCKEHEIRKRLEERCNLSGFELGLETKKFNNFCNVMKSCDMLLMVDGDDIYIMLVTSDYSYCPINEGDDPLHMRSIDLRAMVTRNDLSLELRTALRVQRQLASLDKFYDEIVALSKGEEYVPQYNKDKSKLIPVVYPLRANHQLEFYIPADMTKTEAERLCTFMRTLYFIEGESSNETEMSDKKMVESNLSVEDFGRENRRRYDNLRMLCNGRMSKKLMYDTVERLLFEGKQLEHNKDMVMWYYDYPSNMPADARVDYVYMPTYMAVAFLIKVYLLNPEVVDKYPNFKDVLTKGMLGATGRHFRGAAYDDGRDYRKTLRMFDRAGVVQFLRYNKDWCPEFTKLIKDSGLADNVDFEL